jgi:hypothetical protein
MTNLYWPIYKNLEREIIELSNQIHFDDKQVSVYSTKIAELLIRCSIEIESIAKELYEQAGGDMTPAGNDGNNRDLYFDTDCLYLLESKWELSKKHVVVSASNFYFEKEENRILMPLRKAHKRGTSAADWGKAYQSIKHNRSKNLSQGNVKNLIRAMAALYLLNIYYKDNKYSIEKSSNIKDFDSSLGSDIFSIKVMPSSHFIIIDPQMGFEKRSSFVYIGCYPRHTYESTKKTLDEILQKQKDLILNSIEYKEFRKAGNEINSDNIFTVVRQIGIWHYKRQIMQFLTKEEQLQAIHNSSEYKEYVKRNAGHLKNINPDDIDAICIRVGDYSYTHQVLWLPQKESGIENLYFNSRFDLVLNKNQELYSQE